MQPIDQPGGADQSAPPGNGLRGAALDYGRRGWAVLPLKPREKVPAVAHGLHDATTDLDTIAEWWNATPDANVGLRTGDPFHVLDVDGWVGIGALAAACEERGLLAAGPSVSTPRDGFHLYFAPPAREIGNRAGFLGRCDWRGRGGYVVAPPSIHPNGGTYRWCTDPDVELEPPDAWLVDLLDPPRTVNRIASEPAPMSDRYARAALDAETRAVATAPVGTRNHTLNVAAFNLGQLVGAGLLDPVDTVDRLLGVALAAGLGDTEARRTIASGMQAGIDTPRRVAR